MEEDITKKAEEIPRGEPNPEPEPQQDGVDAPLPIADTPPLKMKGLISERDRCPACNRNLFLILEKKPIPSFNNLMCICPECGCCFVPSILRETIIRQIKNTIIIPPTGFPGAGRHKPGHG